MADDISDVFGSSELLKAADLQGHTPTVVIAAVEPRQFKDGGKLVISFQGKKKKLICNKTNAGRIAYMYGTKFPAWVGKEIQLYTDLVEFNNKTVEAIRVRPPQKRNGQVAAAPAPSPKPRMSEEEEYQREQDHNDGADEAIPF